jgi:hypothetical protein
MALLRCSHIVRPAGGACTGDLAGANPVSQDRHCETDPTDEEVLMSDTNRVPSRATAIPARKWSGWRIAVHPAATQQVDLASLVTAWSTLDHVEDALNADRTPGSVKAMVRLLQTCRRTWSSRRHDG